MKRRIVLTLALFLCTAAGAASVSAKEDTPTDSRVMPVLVDVNTKGEVTEVTPAYKLRPPLERLLRDTVQKVVTKPALEHGKPVSCQFVLNLEMITTARDDGKYGLKLKYISRQALPPGGWYWVRTSEPGHHNLALASKTGSPLQFVVDRHMILKQFDALMGYDWPSR